MSTERLPAIGAPVDGVPPLRKVAIEEHFMDPGALGAEEPFDALEFARRSALEPGFVQVVMRRMADLHDRRIEEMDAAGIDIAVLSLTAPGIEGIVDAARAQDAARAVNDGLAEQVERSRGRLRGFASVPLQEPAAAAREAERAVRELGLCGVMVNGYVQTPDPGRGAYLDADRFTPFWETVASLDVPVYLHPRPSLPGVQDAWYDGHPELAGATWGFAPETATHALRLVYSGLFDRLPGLNLILGHLGETIPYMAWRIQRCFEFNPLGHQVQRRLQDYLADNLFVTTSGHLSDQALIAAILTIGADRIMFATDFPFEMSDDAARWLEQAPVSENDRRKIAAGNARSLLGL